jgi:hypothetical protein
LNPDPIRNTAAVRYGTVPVRTKRVKNRFFLVLFFRNTYAARTLFREQKDEPPVWDNYFLILESLEEKEPHLIQQVLSRLTHLSLLHPSWVLIVFARFFHHQNVTVIKYGLEALLTREGCYDWGDLVDLTDFLVSQLFGVLNESRIYAVAEDGQHYGEVLRYVMAHKCSVADPGCLSRTSRILIFFHSGSNNNKRDCTTFKYVKPTKLLLSSQKYGCRIRYPQKPHPGSRDQKVVPDSGYGFATLYTGTCRVLFLFKTFFYKKSCLFT